MPEILAIDIGGTKMAAAVVDDVGRLRGRGQVATQPSLSGDALFDTLASLADEVLLATGATPEACGVGCGGPMTAGGKTVSPLNIEAWRGYPLRGRLVEHLGFDRVGVDNDAKALALGEGWLGAARDVDDYLAMVVSTGVGGGIVVDGRALDGAAGNAGHIGHIIVEPDGRACACGSRGCLEAEASGTAIAAITGRPASEAGPAMRRRVGTLVGRAVAQSAVLLDLRLALVGGSVGLGYGEVLVAAAQAEIDRLARIEFCRGLTIANVGLGPDAPLIGAAALGRRALMQS
ncbi:MAG: ROK family protein [Acidimicrobiia bacterium]|nr:ROK family protein [Acidimicrobiia bacterium]